MADPPQKSQGDLQRQVETKILGRKEMDKKRTISILKARYDHAKELKAYLYKIDVATDPFNECDKEQSKVETFKHLLCDCLLLDQARKASMSMF